MKINRFIKDAIKNTRALNKSVSVNAPAESKSKKRKFIVKDWTGREMDFGTFRTFDDAWDYLYKKFKDDDDLQEYFVEQVTL